MIVPATLPIRWVFVVWGLCLSRPAALTAQNDTTLRSRNRALLLERQFGPDASGPVVVALERKVVYWAEVIGGGTLVVQTTRRGGRPAFLVPIAAGIIQAHRGELLIDSAKGRGTRMTVRLPAAAIVLAAAN